MLINIWRMGVRRMGPDSFQWCAVTGQGATGINWSIGSSVWTEGRTSSLWGWRSTGTGCPGRLWILLLWRYSRPAWTRSSTACCRWPCFDRRFGLDDPQRSLPTPTILWFSDSLSLKTERAKRHSIIKLTYIILIVLLCANTIYIYICDFVIVIAWAVSNLSAAALPRPGESLAISWPQSRMDGAKQPPLHCTSVAKGKRAGCMEWLRVRMCSADRGLGAWWDPDYGLWPWVHLQGGAGAASSALCGTIYSVHFTGKAGCVNCVVIVILSCMTQLLAKFSVKTNIDLLIP